MTGPIPGVGGGGGGGGLLFRTEHPQLHSRYALRQDKTRQCFIWSLIQSYVYRLYPNNLKV